MSTKIDCITYLKQNLVAASSNLKNAQLPNLEAARRLDRITLSAEGMSSGYWSRIQPLYDPITPKMLLTVQQLNNDIIAGQDLADFDSYVEALVEMLQS